MLRFPRFDSFSIIETEDLVYILYIRLRSFRRVRMRSWKWLLMFSFDVVWPNLHFDAVEFQGVVGA